MEHNEEKKPQEKKPYESPEIKVVPIQIEERLLGCSHPHPGNDGPGRWGGQNDFGKKNGMS